MSTITAILEADEDGTLHLPLPPEYRGGKVEVTATITPIPSGTRSTKDEMLAARKKLNELGAFREISDPVAWQREIRKDRPLPGRE
jgi:hypothetical protein